jgi:hypothetical protein
MKQLLNDWMFYLRMFFDRFFINVIMVSVSFTLGIAFVVMVMYLDVAAVMVASQERMTVLAALVLGVATGISITDMLITAIEDGISKKEEEKEKKEAAKCSEKLTSPSA